jgi:hypothetical protein
MRADHAARRKYSRRSELRSQTRRHEFVGFLGFIRSKEN